MSWNRRGFTALEVLATLLVLASAFIAAIAIVIYGSKLAGRAQAEATAWCTAASVAVDQSPMDALNWTTDGVGGAEGYLNGYYVRRTIVDPGPAAGGSGIQDRRVMVNVFEVQGGREVARLVRYEVSR